MKTKTFRLGLTSVEVRPRVTYVSHCGNMGSSFHEVRANVDFLFGVDTFDKLLKLGKGSGSPSYLYVLKLKTKDFKSVVDLDKAKSEEEIFAAEGRLIKSIVEGMLKDVL